MFKKIIAVLLAVLMITGLVGCGGEKPKDENKGNDKPKTSDTTDAPVAVSYTHLTLPTN